MLRMGEFLKTNNKNMSDGRLPNLMRDVEPLADGRMANWGNHVDEISVHIAGPKTDWANQGCIRPHKIIPLGPNNSDLCAERALIDLYEACPGKFPMSTENIFSPWRTGNYINSGHLDAHMRSAVYKKGAGHASFLLHSIRAQGATALHHATKDVELVARIGRWGGGGESISPYLWESHQMLTGLGVLMVANSHTRYIRRPNG